MPEAPDRWQRHDLLRVRAPAWAETLRRSPRLASVPCVATWAERGWPLIVRRRSQEDDPEKIPVALPLPPCCGKLRIPTQLAAEDVLARRDPVALRAVREEVPSSWREAVDGLLAVAEQTGVEPRVFGSVLWQSLTGLPYLSPTSDLDLLWPVHDRERADHLTRLLAAKENTSAVRFDGELLLPDGGGVQWREWKDSPCEVLVKNLAGVRLCATANLFPA